MRRRIARAAETGPGRAPGRKAPESGRHLGAVSEGKSSGDHPEGHPGDAISFGHPSRSRPRTRISGALVWRGPGSVSTRSSSSHFVSTASGGARKELRRLRLREAFPRAGILSSRIPTLPGRSRFFEIWIRPVVPANAHARFESGIYELQKMIDQGLTQEQFLASASI